MVLGECKIMLYKVNGSHNTQVIKEVVESIGMDKYQEEIIKINDDFYYSFHLL